RALGEVCAGHDSLMFPSWSYCKLQWDSWSMTKGRRLRCAQGGTLVETLVFLRLAFLQLPIISSGIVLERGFIVWILAKVFVCVQRERGLYPFQRESLTIHACHLITQVSQVIAK